MRCILESTADRGTMQAGSLRSTAVHVFFAMKQRLINQFDSAQNLDYALLL
jgi:hypothetical protein